MATVRFRLNHPEKAGERSILVELYINSQLKPEISTGEKVLLKHWNGTRANSKAPDYHRLNDNLSRIERELIQLWRDNLNDLSKIKSLMPIVVRGQSSTSQKKRIWLAWMEFDENNKAIKKDKTVKKYNALHTHLIGFEQYNERQSIQKRVNFDIDSLDQRFIESFMNYLRTLPVEIKLNKDGQIMKFKDGRVKLKFPNSQYPYYKLVKIDGIWTAVKDLHFDIHNDTPIPLMDETIFKYIANLKTFLTESKERGYQVDQVYDTWEVIKRRYPIISFSEDELLSIEAFNPHNAVIEYKKQARKDQTVQALTIGRDYLTQECRTGARISDIKRFDSKDVKDMKWVFLPTKGDRENSTTAKLPFTGFSLPAWLTFQKYNFKMPKTSEQKINDNIKLVCKYAGIREEMYIERWAGNMKIRIHGEKWEFISSHTGRKTFITILGNKYKVPIRVLMQYTGIQDIKTIQHYLGESEDEVLEDYLNKAGENTNMSVMRKAN